jgi:hypothetical protein
MGSISDVGRRGPASSGCGARGSRNGVASQMLDTLRREFTKGGTGPKVKWGVTTPEGTAFKRAYYKAKA